MMKYRSAHFFGLGIKTERERIIKIIEETLLIHKDQKFFLIRFIKGENEK